MPRQRILLTDFSAGMVSKKVMGRLDVSYQYKAAELLDGFIVLPDGGVTRRRGTIRVHKDVGLTPSDSGLYGKGATPAFQVIRKGEAKTEKPILLWIEGPPPYAVKAKNLQSGHTSSSNTTNAIHAGEPFYVSSTYYNKPDPSADQQGVMAWTPAGAVRIALQDWGIKDETVREVSAVYQNRLISLDREWGLVWSSVPLDLERYDLAEDIKIPGTNPTEYEKMATGAFFVTPDFYGAERPTWVIAHNGLYFGTDRGEYELTSGFPALSHEPGGAVIRKISAVGAAHAIVFGGDIVLMRRDTLTLMPLGGQINSFASITDLIENASIITMAAAEYGGHRYLLFVDRNRDLYCLTRTPSRGVSGWALLMRNVWWVTTYEEDVYIARPEGDSFAIEVLPLDSLFSPGTRTHHETELFRRKPLYNDYCSYATVDNAGVYIDQLLPSSTARVWAYESGSLTYCGERGVDAAGTLEGSLGDIKNFVGYTNKPVSIAVESVIDTTCSLRTLPVHIANALGPALGEFKQINGVTAIVHRSMGMRSRVNNGPWERWETDEPYTGPVSLVIEAAGDDTVQVEIQSIGDLPLSVMGIEVDAQVEEA